VAWILICKCCKFGEKICCNSRDIEFFLGDYFFWRDLCIAQCHANISIALTAECGSAGHNWHQSMWPHHISVETTPLVTSSTACRVQISHACLQVSSWPHGAISDRRLSTGRQLRSPQATVGWRRLDKCHTPARRQELCCRQSMALEHFTSPPDVELVTFRRLLKPICLSDTRAHSDSRFNCAI